MEVEEEPEGSGCAGAAVITAAALVVLCIAYTASPTVFVLSCWAWVPVWGWLYWRKLLPRTANPAPPAPPERGSDEEPQVTLMRDQSHPNRWVVIRPSKWLDWTDENRDES